MAEGEKAPTRGVNLGSAENYVVGDLDTENAPSFAQLAGDLGIGAGWLRITGGMVVGDDDRNGAGENCASENLARVGQRGGGGADCHQLARDRVAPGSQEDHPERFLDGIKFVDVLEVLVGLGWLIQGAPVDFFEGGFVGDLGFVDTHGIGSGMEKVPCVRKSDAYRVLPA